MQKRVWFIVIEYTWSVFAVGLICMSCQTFHAEMEKVSNNGKNLNPLNGKGLDRKGDRKLGSKSLDYLFTLVFNSKLPNSRDDERAFLKLFDNSTNISISWYT